ncbi:MAG: exodeoxyribonuclease VII small subunit [Proteobacteria bacterium]|nr:exodeoxyribonuclease VII small subunit [Pseudomonadota bacterium]
MSVTEGTSFEQNLQQLEQLVGKLERGDATLEASLAAFEDGLKLIKQCRDQLALAEVKVEKVLAAQAKDEEA